MATEYRVRRADLNKPRPAKVRIFIGQIRASQSEWSDSGGLLYYKEPSKVLERLRQLLFQAKQLSVGLLVLPELSVPEECLEILQTWSKETGSIVVGGSHYHKGSNGYRSQCPVFINGKRFLTHKIRPAPSELSPIPTDSLKPGKEIVIFTNSTAGNFAVLICSDYLDPTLSGRVLRGIKGGIDLLCVPAFQKRSRFYHDRMRIDCEDAENGLYIAYANMLCGKWGDGRSSLFGVMHRQWAEKLVGRKLTADSTSLKIIDLAKRYDYAVLDLDLEHKRPYANQTIGAHPNVEVVKLGKISEDMTPQNNSLPVNKSSLKRFVRTNRAIGRIDLAIRDAVGKTIVSADEFIATFVKRLLFVGIKTLDQLDRALERDESLVTRSAIGWFKDPKGQNLPLIPSGVGISFLCVALIMRDGKGIAQLRDFWREFKFNPKADIEELTMTTAAIYQAAAQATDS